MAQKERLERYLKELEGENLYFVGLPFIKYVSTQAFIRLEKWLGFGLCQELAALAMIALRNNPTSRLCRGVFVNANGEEGGRHYWVEFNLDEFEYVLDLAWSREGFECITGPDDEVEAPHLIRKNKNELVFSDSCNELRLKWALSFEEFWRFELPDQLYAYMHKKETSYIFNELDYFALLEDITIDEHHRSCSDGKHMMPKMIHNKPISIRIIKSFVENSEQERPDDELVEKARKANRVFRCYGINKCMGFI